MSITLSIFFMPLILKFLSSFTNDLLKKSFSRSYRVSIINEDFPLPETPVTQIKFPNGNKISRFFRLLVLTLKSLIVLNLFTFLLFVGTDIFLFLFKYCAVKLLLFFLISVNFPSVITLPP